MNWSDIIGFGVLVSLYLSQGIVITLFTSSFPLILSEQGFSISELWKLNLCSYPFALKIVFAPFLDTFYLTWFGKRKTYIVPANYLSACLLIISSFYLKEMILQGSINLLATLGTLLVFLMAIQDIAVDAWVLKLLSAEKISYGSLSQSIGMQAGFLIAGTCYFILGFDPAVFFFSFGMALLAVNIIIHFSVPEEGFKKEIAPSDKETKQDTKQDTKVEPPLNENPQTTDSLEEVKKSSKFMLLVFAMKGFYKNENLRTLIILALFQNVGVGPLMATFSLRVNKAGISKERISFAQLLLFPLKWIVPICIAQRKSRTLALGQVILKLHLALQIFQFGFLYAQAHSLMTGEWEVLQIIGLMFIQMSESLIISALTQVRSTFYQTIATEGFEGVFLTALTSVNNISRKWIITSFFYINDMINFNLVTPLLWLFHLFFIVLSTRMYKRLEEIPKQQWSLLTYKQKTQ